MKDKIIGVDLDEILAELVDYCLKYNNFKIGNIKVKKEEINNYYIHNDNKFNINSEQAIDWFKKPMLDDIKVCHLEKVNGSLERLLELKKDGNKLIIITARIEEYFGEYTKKWVNNHFPDIFDKIIFTNHFTDKHKNKSEICLELGVDYMIEDNIDYALELAEKGIITYLLEKPWNKYRTEKNINLIKIKSWEEFNSY